METGCVGKVMEEGYGEGLMGVDYGEEVHRKSYMERGFVG